MRLTTTFTLLIIGLLVLYTVAQQWPNPESPVIPEADGYVDIPDAAVAADKAHTYRAIFDASQAAGEPTQLLPAVNMAGALLNELAVRHVPLEHAKLAIVFYGPAVDGLLKEERYRARFGVSNPNLKVLSTLKKAGVELFTCGQGLAFGGIDPATLSPEVKVAADALILLIRYQNEGYALLDF